MIKNKKAVSVMIGYVLLIAFGIIMSIIVYGYLKTYVPRDGFQCPEGTSLFLKSYSCSSGDLNITLKNTGKFNLAGYFIRSSNESSLKIATKDLSTKITGGGTNHGQSIIFGRLNENSMIPKEEFSSRFENIPTDTKIIEIIPVRWQTEEGSLRFVSCGNAKIFEEINC